MKKKRVSKATQFPEWETEEIELEKFINLIRSKQTITALEDNEAFAQSSSK